MLANYYIMVGNPFRTEKNNKKLIDCFWFDIIDIETIISPIRKKKQNKPFDYVR